MLQEASFFVNTHLQLWFIGCFFVLGCCIGSFLNVCSFRLPLKQSLLYPGSHCKCGTPIAWYYNIPLLGWLILRGRSACCQTPICLQYPLVEGFTGLAFLLCWYFHPTLKGLVGMVFVTLLILGGLLGLRRTPLPATYLLLSAGTGICLAGLFPELYRLQMFPSLLQPAVAVLTSFTALIVSSGIVLWLGLLIEYLFHKDYFCLETIFYLGFIGSFLGWEGALVAFGWSCVLMTAYVLLRRFRPLSPPASLLPLPFPPAISISSLFYFLLG